jgi:hypothetical protein
MNKHRTAMVAATLVTLVVCLGMFVIGTSAAMNKNGVPVKDSPTSGGAAVTTSIDPAQVVQMQNLITQYQQRDQQYQQREQQYQQREQQYQAQLNSAQQQLDQTANQLAQYQRVLQFLIDRGIIQVDSRGRIFLPNN